MNIGTILEWITAPILKAHAIATMHRLGLVVAAETIGALLLLWGVVYRPRTCILIAVAAYLIHRYGPKLLDRAPMTSDVSTTP